ncbi:hypothetical protein [Nocardia seriolae]|uniref:DUF2007 domain-containing protein n=2 Tax=Nocardia seriolae TaxID=37332 RepID=A0ABC9YXD7_9NOCA|nr:hypothetical protein [Nocardia seriolae]GEM25359.1 hypothetical protein NS2_35980 [Nocardia seriolae NBRC 15557]APA99960.1 hypothetical protein NS506_05924 [Nocardia seriolae]MTK50055.1 hypothetical protein [Nocardia seriolae]QUN16042.1 hypothetical protein KEC46_27685 [Nocardia seriolae]WKY54894.1 hypothetical protein Q5P07_13160 [Nocardia seriolae]
MTTAREVPDPWSGHRGAAHWVPSRGVANGLSGHGWGVLADLDESQIYRVLFALTDEGIAAYVLPVRTTVLEPGDPDVVWRLWVDLSRFRAAEDLLMELLRYGRSRRSPQPAPGRRRRRRVPLVRKSR